MFKLIKSLFLWSLIGSSLCAQSNSDLSPKKVTQSSVDAFICEWDGGHITPIEALHVVNYFSLLFVGHVELVLTQNCDRNPFSELAAALDRDSVDRNKLVKSVSEFFFQMDAPTNLSESYARDLLLLTAIRLACDDLICFRKILHKSGVVPARSPVFCDFSTVRVEEHVRDYFLRDLNGALFFICDGIIGRKSFGDNIVMFEDSVPEWMREVSISKSTPGIEWWALFSDLTVLPRKVTSK